jgi:hypothetical protein
MENGTVIDVRHTIFFVKGDIKRVHPEFLDELAELYTTYKKDTFNISWENSTSVISNYYRHIGLFKTCESFLDEVYGYNIDCHICDKNHCAVRTTVPDMVMKVILVIYIEERESW